MEDSSEAFDTVDSMLDLSALLQSIDVGPTHTSKGHRLSKAARMRRHKRLLQAAEDLGIPVSLLEAADKHGREGCTSSSAPCSSDSAGSGTTKTTPSVSPKLPVQAGPVVGLVADASGRILKAGSLRGHLVKALEKSANLKEFLPATPPKGTSRSARTLSNVTKVVGDDQNIVVPLRGSTDDEEFHDPSNVLGFLGLSETEAGDGSDMKPRPTLLSRRRTGDGVGDGWPVIITGVTIGPPPGLSPPGSKRPTGVEQDDMPQASALLPSPGMVTEPAPVTSPKVVTTTTTTWTAQAEAASQASTAALAAFMVMSSAQRLYVKQHMVQAVEHGLCILTPYPLSDLMATQVWGPVAHDAVVLHRFLAFAEAMGGGALAGAALLHGTSMVQWAESHLW